jgi:hypothetical protein
MSSLPRIRRSTPAAAARDRRELDLLAQKQACDELEAYLAWRLKTLVAEGLMLETAARCALQRSA